MSKLDLGEQQKLREEIEDLVLSDVPKSYCFVGKAYYTIFMLPEATVIYRSHERDLSKITLGINEVTNVEELEEFCLHHEEKHYPKERNCN